MKKLTVIMLAIVLSACADMTPREKYWTAAAVSVVAVGAIAVYEQRHGDTMSTDPRRTVEPVNCNNPAACK